MFRKVKNKNIKSVNLFYLPKGIELNSVHVGTLIYNRKDTHVQFISVLNAQEVFNADKDANIVEMLDFLGSIRKEIDEVNFSNFDQFNLEEFIGKYNQCHKYRFGKINQGFYIRNVG